jgi:hypothetical protein
MRHRPRRPTAALAAALAVLLAGCGGAGYGDPIAATDVGTGTVALAPAPVTTPSAAPAATTEAARPTTTVTGGGTTTGTTTTGGTTGGGGSTQGGGGGGTADVDSIAAYAVDANRFCRGFKDATRALTTDIGGAGSDTKAVGAAVIRYGAAIDDAVSGLRAAPVPSAVRSYHQRTLRWASGVTSAISASRSGLRSGSASAGATVVGKVQDLGGPPLGSAVPAALRARATACAS